MATQDVHNQGRQYTILNIIGFGLDNRERYSFVVEVVNDLGANQTKLAAVLGISRQTIHNYRETHKYFGLDGLIHGYNPDVSRDMAKQRKLHADQLPHGNKAEQVAAIRAEQRERRNHRNQLPR